MRGSEYHRLNGLNTHRRLEPPRQWLFKVAWWGGEGVAAAPSRSPRMCQGNRRDMGVCLTPRAPFPRSPLLLQAGVCAAAARYGEGSQRERREERGGLAVRGQQKDGRKKKSVRGDERLYYVRPRGTGGVGWGGEGGHIPTVCLGLYAFISARRGNSVHTGSVLIFQKVVLSEIESCCCTLPLETAHFLWK